MDNVETGRGQTSGETPELGESRESGSPTLKKWKTPKCSPRHRSTASNAVGARSTASNAVDARSTASNAVGASHNTETEREQPTADCTTDFKQDLRAKRYKPRNEQRMQIVEDTEIGEAHTALNVYPKSPEVYNEYKTKSRRRKRSTPQSSKSTRIPKQYKTAEPTDDESANNTDEQQTDCQPLRDKERCKRGRHQRVDCCDTNTNAQHLAMNRPVSRVDERDNVPLLNKPRSEGLVFPSPRDLARKRKRRARQPRAIANPKRHSKRNTATETRPPVVLPRHSTPQSVGYCVII